MKRIGIKLGMVLACGVLLSACGLADRASGRGLSKGVWEDETVAFSTALMVNSTEINLGMSQEAFFKRLGQDSFRESDGFTGVVCDEVAMDLYYHMTYEEGTFQVLDENAKVKVWFCGKDADARLAELVVEWQEVVDEEKLMEALVATYGDTYKKDTVFLAGYQEAYRWDMEDGTSVFLVPANEAVVEYVQHDLWKEGIFWIGPVLIMAPTEDVTNVAQQEAEG